MVIMVKMLIIIKMVFMVEMFIMVNMVIMGWDGHHGIMVARVIMITKIIMVKIAIMVSWSPKVIMVMVIGHQDSGRNIWKLALVKHYKQAANNVNLHLFGHSH